MKTDLHHETHCPCAEMSYPDLADYDPVTPEGRTVTTSPRSKGWLRIAAAAESVNKPAYQIQQLVDANVVYAEFYQGEWFVAPVGLASIFDQADADEINAKVQAVQQWRSGMRAFDRRRAAVHEKWLREQDDSSDDRYSSSSVSEDSSSRSHGATRLATFLSSWASKSSCVKVLP